MEDFVSMLLNFNFLLVAVALGVLGVVIKAIPKVPSWIIPFMNTILGVLVMMALGGWDVASGLVGVCAAGVATLAYEAFKQIFENFVKPKEAVEASVRNMIPENVSITYPEGSSTGECSWCGTELSSTDDFCPGCRGNVVTGEAKPETPDVKVGGTE